MEQIQIGDILLSNLPKHNPLVQNQMNDPEGCPIPEFCPTQANDHGWQRGKLQHSVEISEILSHAFLTKIS